MILQAMNPLSQFLLGLGFQRGPRHAHPLHKASGVRVAPGRQYRLLLEMNREYPGIQEMTPS